jgi:hypothetical protein
MRNMAREAGDRSAVIPGKAFAKESLRSRRRRPVRVTNGDFLLAFADALRDILREERRRAA